MESVRDAGYFTALRLFNSGHYFEAHEAWEEVWRLAKQPERGFLQGLIQAAVAIHHYQNHNIVGAISLARKALRKLDGYPDIFVGTKVGLFRTHFTAWLDAVKAGTSPKRVRIQLLSDSDSRGDL